MQTILGAGGVIGNYLAKELPAFTDEIRLVSRNPKKVNDNDQLVSANLLIESEVDEAVLGSSIVYLTVGLPYSKKIWKEQWPILMQNVIAACKKHNAKLVFFDNIYMYGPSSNPLTEESPFNPVSVKGVVRTDIVNMLQKEIDNGELTALIARAPEFYGPPKTLSIINAMVFDNIKKDKKLQLAISDKNLRTLIYTPDAGKATALLGNTIDAYNQTWHLPCITDPITGKEIVNLSSRYYGKELKYTVLKKWMIQLFGLFNPYGKEMVEMLYQFEQDYIFDSSKFKKRFTDFSITSYENGIKQIVEEMKDNSSH